MGADGVAAAIDLGANEHRRFDLPIEGMSCASCAAKVEKALGSLHGARRAAVNLATKVATVEGAVTLREVLDTVTGTGFTVPTRTHVLPVSGMSCASCASKIERLVGALPGVTAAAVSFADETLTVSLVPGMITRAGVAATVGEAGYTAIVPEGGDTDLLAIADEMRSREKRELRRRLLVAVPIAVLFMVAMSLRSRLALIERIWSPWLELVLATPVQFYAGWPFLAGSWKALRTRSTDMNVLIATGTLAAYGFSLAMLLFPTFFSGAHASHVYFEAAVEIIALILLGRYLEASAKAKTGTAIRLLVGLQPKEALRLEGDTTRPVPIDRLRSGDLIVVAPGERIPVDGVVADGQSAVDASALTGEAEPVDRGVGDEVMSGSVNVSGRLVLRASRVGEETTLAQVVRLVREAQGTKAPVQRLADRVSAVFVPAVMVVATLSFIGWLALGPEPRLANAVVSAVTVLIIACPCALGLATPTAVIVGVGRGATQGILIKNAEAIEQMQSLRVLALDKTGTLTAGKPVVQTVLAVAGKSRADVLRIAASAELGNRHPIAIGIVRAAESEGIAELTHPSRTRNHPGGGLEAIVGGQTVWIGSPVFVRRMAGGVEVPEAWQRELDAARSSVIAVAVEQRLIGVLGTADPLRPEARAFIAQMKARGLRTVLLTGDRRAVAESVGRELGIEEVHAELLPQQKLDEIKRLQSTVGPVAMVGDGINDAPALTQADVGVAIGAGSDIAAEAGDIVLVQSRLDQVSTAVALSRTTMRTIKQNLFLSFVYNTLAIPIAAGLLYPFLGLRLQPWMAAAAMALSDVSVIGNSLLLRRRPLR